MTLEGGCHCGAVRFVVQVAEPGAIVCDCSICTMKGFVHHIVGADAFTLLRGGEVLQSYTFGTHTARHTFCARCGMHPFYRPRSHPEGYSVNLRCLDDTEPLETWPRTRFQGSRWEEHIEELRS